MAQLDAFAERFSDLLDTPAALGAALTIPRVNAGGTALEFASAATIGDGAWLRLDGSNDPVTGNIDMSADVVPSADQTRNIGGLSDRFLSVNGRFGVFCGFSSGGGGEPPAAGGNIATGLNPTGIIAGNQVQGGSGAATHYLRGSQFKGVACVGNSHAGGAGDALLSNRSGGSSLFGSAYTFGAGNATVEATSFGNFTSAYAYCNNNDHSFSNGGPGAFLAGYSQGSGTVDVDILGSAAGAFCNVRPIASTNTATARVVVSGGGAFCQGLQRANSAGNTTTQSASGEGSFSQGVVQGVASLSVSGAGAFVQGRANGNSITATANGSFARGDASFGPISATAINANQFAPGTNSLAISIGIGDITGNGVRLAGAGAPATPANGDVWKAGGFLFGRSNGVSVRLGSSAAAWTAGTYATRRSFAGLTPTTGEVLELLETLVEELQASGVIN